MVETRRVFITGGTRGLGRCLAWEFSLAGCSVFVTGRELAPARETAAAIAGQTGAAVFAGSGDVGSWQDLSRLADEAAHALGGIDIWVNNAGVNQGRGMVWELLPEDIEQVLRTDLLGAMLGAKAAIGALGDSGGWVWFVEGHGSDGRIMPGLSGYGTAKRGLGYYWRALAKEAEVSGLKVKIGAVSPGIMITDFVRGSLEGEDSEKRKRAISVFNILGDKPETVAAYLVPRMLAARRNGTRIAWLTGAKAAWRFVSAPLVRRRVIEE
jgi:NAD(P)-dependent dehydrogenase (short-subunit alcohol dehydrogenase family)